jgi:hypothetical protein
VRYRTWKKSSEVASASRGDRRGVRRRSAVVAPLAPDEQRALESRLAAHAEDYFKG